MDDVLDKNPMSRFERTLLLLRNIGKKMCKPEEATVVMKQFLEILEHEAAFHPLVKKISENKILMNITCGPKRGIVVVY